MERKVLIKDQNTSGAMKEFTTSACTFGDLKEQLKHEISFDNVRVVCRENRNNLELATAALPPTDFTLFIYPLKTKAGVDKYDAMSFQELRKVCASREGITGDKGNYGSVDNMREALRASDKASKFAGATAVAKPTITEDTVLDKLAELRRVILSGLDEIEEAVSNMPDTTVVIDSFKQRLEEEYKEIEAIIK